MGRKLWWPPEAIGLLGTIPDTEFARQLGYSVFAVRAKREELRIPPHGKRGRPAIVWTAEMDALLGTMPDARVAQKLGLSIYTVLHRRKALGRPPYSPYSKWDTPAFRRDATYLTAGELAEKYGLNTSAAYALRKRFGGQPCLGPGPGPARPSSPSRRKAATA